MASRGRGQQGRVEERSKRELRADRILDAAAELIERWGYNKTTIDDIARQAGVAKGTIYLHWKSRDDLFWTLLTREDIRVSEAIRRGIAAEPAGMTLHSLIKHIMLATMQSPLSKAMLLMDSAMLGDLARRDFASASFPERMGGFKDFLAYMRDQGAIRADISVEEHIYMLSAIATGFLMIDQWMPPGLTYADEQIADMTADAIRRTLEPLDTDQSQAAAERNRAIASAFSAYIGRSVETRLQETQNEESDRL